MSIFNITGIDACYSTENGYELLLFTPQDIVIKKLQQYAKTQEDFEEDDLEDFYCLWVTINNKCIITEVWLGGCNDQHFTLPVSLKELKEIHKAIHKHIIEFILSDISLFPDMEKWNGFINNLDEETKEIVLDACLMVINRHGTKCTLESVGYKSA